MNTDKHVSYIFNKTCNWDCSYCNQQNCDRSKVDEDILFDRFSSSLTTIIDNCDNNIWLHLVGGEPGLWSEELWNNIILFVNENTQIRWVTIYSNGTIFTNPYFKTNKSCCNISWHCSETLDEKITYPFDVNEPRSGYIIGKTVAPIVVLTKDNYKKLPGFLKMNPELKTLQVVLCSSSKLSNYENEFTEDDLKSIHKMLIQHSDIISILSIFEVGIYLNRFNNRKEIYSVCKKQVNKITIDLVDQLIYHCCYYNNSIPLTSDNLLIKQKNIDCTGCFNPSMYFQESKGELKHLQ